MVETLKHKFLTRNKQNETYTTERFIFRGNGTAVVTDNPGIITDINPTECKVYVGAPMAIRKDDVSFVLKKKRGNNVLIVGTQSQYLDSLIINTIKQIIQQSPGGSTFKVFYPYNENINSKLSIDTPQVSHKEPLSAKIILNLKKTLDSRIESRKGTEQRIVWTILNIREYASVFEDIETRNAFADIIINGPVWGIYFILHSERMIDIDSLIKKPIPIFGSFQSVEDFVREFKVKIELKGIDAYEIFPPNNNFISPRKGFQANIQTGEGNEIKKFGIYN